MREMPDARESYSREGRTMTPTLKPGDILRDNRERQEWGFWVKAPWETSWLGWSDRDFAEMQWHDATAAVLRGFPMQMGPLQLGPDPNPFADADGR